MLSCPFVMYEKQHACHLSAVLRGAYHAYEGPSVI
uniref:Uncharacterized protein n=1 Tax=Arundo donax TaxID=35708 RepID=A0A0A9CVP1_ARUDO